MKLIRKTLFMVLMISILFTNFNSYGQNNKKTDPCENAQTQIEMNDCAKREFDKTDAKLNKIYNQLMSKLEGEHKTKLKAAELAWIKYRDANCECESFLNQGGTIYPLVYNGCLTTMTNNR